MNDLELAEEIEHAAEHDDCGYERVWFTANGDLQIRCRNPEERRQIIAALRRGPVPVCSMGYACGDLKCPTHHPSPPSGEMVMVSRFALDSAADALERNDKFAGGVAEDIRRWLSVAEAEGRKG